VEVGPGRVLTGLIRRIVPGTSVHAVDNPGADGIWLPS
jgi:malonyl CoA-acyl carrier protein transacylase